MVYSSYKALGPYGSTGTGLQSIKDTSDEFREFIVPRGERTNNEGLIPSYRGISI